MGTAGESHPRIRFHSFELDLRTRELRKRGVKLKLRGHPIDLLALLLECPGELVTRETLHQKLWPGNTFVDFEHILNNSVNRLREALGDKAGAPRFIETLPGLGYRFIAPVEFVGPPGAAVQGQAAGSSRGNGLSWEVEDGQSGRGREGARVNGQAIEPQAAAFASAERQAPHHHLHGANSSPAHAGVRIAVLPFTNVDGETRDHFGEGLAAQITVQLGRACKGLSVVFPVSSLHFAGTAKSIPNIAQELKADYLLAGTVWRVPPRLRICAQLIRADDQCCTWGESYTRQDTDVFAVVDEITRSISGALLQTLTASGEPQACLTTTPAIYATYLKARFFSYQFKQSSFEKAVQLFEQVIAEDPHFAPAQAALAHMLAAAVTYAGAPPRVLYERIESLACQALAGWGEIAEAHSALATSKLWQADWAAAESGFLRAVEVNPSFSHSYIGQAHLLAARGCPEKAVQVVKRACELDPLSPVAHSMRGYMQYCNQDLAGAHQGARNALEIEPEFAPAHEILSVVYAAMHRPKEAVCSAREGVRCAPDSAVPRCHLGRALAAAGEREEATRILNELLDLRKTICVPATLLAAVYSALGQREQMWQWLETAEAELDPWRIHILANPVFSPVRDDVRFQDLLYRMGLPLSP